MKWWVKAIIGGVFLGLCLSLFKVSITSPIYWAFLIIGTIVINLPVKDGE